MRLFVALPLPSRILDEVETAVAPLRSGWPDLRWVRRDLLHLTVAFFGEVDDRTLDRMVLRLERVARRHDPLTLSLCGAGAFPGGGAHARVVWTGLYGDRRALAGLAASVTAAGNRAGSRFGEHRAFRPHLTLARCRRPIDVRPLLDALSAFSGSPWTAGSIHLMRSHLGARVRHEILRTWPLGGPGTPDSPDGAGG
jgi:2'-5' RNA ligase